jgi:Cu/Ag efflux protein CusF
MKNLFLLALMVVAAVACQKSEPVQTDTSPPPANVDATPSSDSAASAERTYTMNGKLVSRDTVKNEVTIDSEEIPGGVMASMVMAYELRGAKVDSLPPDGSKITSSLHEQNGKYWVTDVKPVQ